MQCNFLIHVKIHWIMKKNDLPGYFLFSQEFGTINILKDKTIHSHFSDWRPLRAERTISVSSASTQIAPIGMKGMFSKAKAKYNVCLCYEPQLGPGVLCTGEASPDGH